MNDWITHKTHNEPDSLASDQLIETTWPKNIKLELKDGREKQIVPVHQVMWGPGVEYRVVTDDEGVGYCTSDELKDTTQYIASQWCEIGGKRALQFTSKPTFDKPSMVAPFGWTNGNNSGRVDAPDSKIKPGECGDSLLRVWRK